MNEAYSGLQLPDVIGPSEEDAIAICTKWNTQPIAEMELAQEGFLPMAKPNFIFPEISLELLTSPDTRNYTDTYRCALAWVDYTRDKVARIEMELLQMKNTKKEMERKLRRMLVEGSKAGSAKRPTLQEQSDYIESDPTYSNLSVRLQYLQQKELVYKSELDHYVDAVKLLSRNVEIRRENFGAGNSQAGSPMRRPGFPGQMP